MLKEVTAAIKTALVFISTITVLSLLDPLRKKAAAVIKKKRQRPENRALFKSTLLARLKGIRRKRTAKP